MSIARFGIRKPVPVNLLMIAILLGGLVTGLALRREFFPETTPEQAIITMPYPGAAPEEIETSLAIKVEDALRKLEEVDEIRTTLAEGGGGMTVEFREGVDPDKAFNEIERTIDALQDLPERAEKIEVELFEPRLPVIRVALFGDLSEAVMKRAIRAVREDLRSLPGMGDVVIDGVRDYEVRVDVEMDALLKQGLSIEQIRQRIGAWMEDVPGGTIRGQSGNIKLRTLGVEERADAIRNIVLRSDAQGKALRVGDIATVREDFTDDQIINRFNGKPAAALTVFKVGKQDIVSMAKMVRAYVDGRNGKPFRDTFTTQLVESGRLKALHVIMAEESVEGLEQSLTSDVLQAYWLGKSNVTPLPAGVSIETMSDLARFVEGRLDLLIRNALWGAMLVFLTLLAFLNWRVALWVGAGLTTALMGTVLVMWYFDITLNLLTMFGLIVVLGLLVDDAIVVAENIQSWHDRGEPALKAAVHGTEQVLWPVVATVLTSIVAFLPLTFIKGNIGELLGALPAVVACALMMSLVESLVILPSHMGHTLAKRDRSKPGRFVDHVRRVEGFRDHLLFDRLIPSYTRLLDFVLRYRYASLAAAVAALMISVGLIQGGRVVFTFLSSSDAETIVVDMRMPIGTPLETTEAMVAKIEEAAFAQPETKNVATVVGQQSNIDTGVAEASASHVAQMFIELVYVEERDRQSSQIINSIRQYLEPHLKGIDRISYTEISGGPGGKDITIEVRGQDASQVQQAVTDVKKQLASFEGVYDISDDDDRGQLELQVQLKPAGAALGFTQQDVANQLRGYLFGLDAHVFAADEEDIDVRVRLAENTRTSLWQIQNSWLVSPTGQAVPLSEIAHVDQTAGYATIRRVDRERSVTVSADTAPDISPESITPKLDLDAIHAAYPGVTLSYGGRQEQLADAFGSLPYGFLAAMVMIYVILAWLFGRYTQPLLIMLAIPFAIIGVVWGHLLLGYEMTFLSLIGFVALSGIVVNDSLILVEFYNKQREAGESIHDSLVSAGRARLRAILLTTITTVLGLTPLILEQSFQAKFLIPMAISIAAGLLSTTVLILLVLPCVIAAFADLQNLLYWLWHGEARPQQPVLPDIPDDL